MVWKGVETSCLTLAIALAGMGGVSYIYRFDTILSPNGATRYPISIGEGRLRVVYLNGTSVASTVGPSPLDEYARLWTTVPTRYFRWRSCTRLLSDGTDVHEFAVSVTLFAPLVALLPVVFIIRPALKHPRRSRLICAEILRTSHRNMTARRRWVRRATIAVLGCGAAASATYWAFGCNMWKLGFGRRIGWHVTRTPLPLDVAHHVDLMNPYAPWSILLTADNRGVSFARGVQVAQGTVAPTQTFELVGFGWKQGIQSPSLTFELRHGRGTPSTVQDEQMRDTKEIYYQSLRLPLWVPFTLCSVWPVVAFFRGPWCRSGRRTNGLCGPCGYDLTGNESGTCPECGEKVERSG